MLGKYLDNLRRTAPLVHNITNYVTVNDVANVILACGASPIMSDEPDDVEEITSICGGLNINIGTLNTRSIESMFIAGKKANELGHIVVMDPVGAGASSLRTGTAIEIMENIRLDLIKGNISEIKALSMGTRSTKGVEADINDEINKENLHDVLNAVKEYAESIGSIVVVSGKIDLISDGNHSFVIYNGTPAMSKVTGTGCQLSGMLAAFLAANPDDKLEAAAAAVCTMGVAGEKAWSEMKNYDGNATYRNRIIDAVYNMNGEILDKGARYDYYKC